MVRSRAILSLVLFFSDDRFAIFVDEVVDVFGFLIATRGIE